MTDLATSALPPEGDEDEAQELIRRRPLELPKYRLERVAVANLAVDYAPPHGAGYARPLSQPRLAWLRRHWDPLACSPLMVSRRADGSLYVIDGNHRRVVAYDMGYNQIPAMVLQGLERTREADLYGKLGTVLGQTPATRFRAKLVAGDPACVDIMHVVELADLELDLSGGRHRDGIIQAIARVEWLYARGGKDGLLWTLELLVDAYEGERDSLTDRVLEGAFGFWLRFSKRVDRELLVQVLQGAGLPALDDRSSSIFRRITTNPGNSVGMAMLEMYNASRLVATKLPAWQDKVVGPSIQQWQKSSFIARHGHSYQTGRDPAPQQLGAG